MFTTETRTIIDAKLHLARRTGAARDYQDLTRAVISHHPLLAAMDALLKAAKVYHEQYGVDLAHSDSEALHDWLRAAKSVRRLLNLDFGPIHAGAVEAVFWKACAIAGLSETAVDRAAWPDGHLPSTAFGRLKGQTDKRSQTMKTFAAIKAAVDAGLTVCWSQDNYVVRREKWGEYVVVCTNNGHRVGLFEPDYNPGEFYLIEEEETSWA